MTDIAISDEWAGILAKDEQILWQGRPSGRVRLEFSSAVQPFFFLFFTGFSVFWMWGAAQAGGIFWMFGLLFFGIGASNLIGIHFWRAYQRRHTFYTLTNRRALIGTQLFGRRELRSYPITRDSPVTLADGTPGSVFFGDDTRRDGDGNVVSRSIGFEMIDDCRAVYARIRDMQAAG